MIALRRLYLSVIIQTTDMSEIWKDIIGYEGYYQASNLGNIRAIHRTIIRKDGGLRTYKERVKGQIVNFSGYKAVHFTKHCNGQTITVHSLVAKAFIENTFNLEEVNHIDGNKHNNTVENLEWVSSGDNTRHAWRLGLCENTRNANKKKVKCLLTGKSFNSISEAAKETGVTARTMSKYLCVGKKNNPNYQYAD